MLFERPDRVLEMLLAAWFGQPEIRAVLREAVERYVTDGADPTDLAAGAGDGQRQMIAAGVIRSVAAQIDAGQADAERAVRWAQDVATNESSNVAELQQAAAILRSDLSGELAFKNAVDLARGSTFSWPEDGPLGNRGSLSSTASRVSWSLAVMTLGRRFAGCCLACGQPVQQDWSVPVVMRSGDVREQSARRDYCVDCVADGELKKAAKREKALKRWVPLLAEAIDRREAESALTEEIARRRVDPGGDLLPPSPPQSREAQRQLDLPDASPLVCPTCGRRYVSRTGKVLRCAFGGHAPAVLGTPPVP